MIKENKIITEEQRHRYIHLFHQQTNIISYPHQQFDSGLNPDFELNYQEIEIWTESGKEWFDLSGYVSPRKRSWRPSGHSPTFIEELTIQKIQIILWLLSDMSIIEKDRRSPAGIRRLLSMNWQSEKDQTPIGSKLNSWNITSKHRISVRIQIAMMGILVVFRDMSWHYTHHLSSAVMSNVISMSNQCVIQYAEHTKCKQNLCRFVRDIALEGRFDFVIVHRIAPCNEHCRVHCVVESANHIHHVMICTFKIQRETCGPSKVRRSSQKTICVFSMYSERAVSGKDDARTAIQFWLLAWRQHSCCMNAEHETKNCGKVSLFLLQN